MKAIVEIYKDNYGKFETTTIHNVTSIDFDKDYINFFVATRHSKYYFSANYLKRLELAEE